jgi:hypothetical protein
MKPRNNGKTTSLIHMSFDFTVDEKHQFEVIKEYFEGVDGHKLTSIGTMRSMLKTFYQNIISKRKKN